MLSWFKRFVSKIHITPVDSPIISPTTSSFQEDPKISETIKRIEAVFEEQEQQINARVLKAHDSTCMDPFLCTKEPCFIREPDKIIGTTIVDIPKKQLESIARAKKSFAAAQKVRKKVNSVDKKT